jgi:uncharacterized protein GlcG (DUF336 family)
METKKILTLEDAKLIAAAADAEAKRNNWRVAITVVDDGGHLIYLQKADGTQIGSIEVSQGKAKTALLFKRPTKAWEERLADGRLGFLAMPGLVPVEGGLPLTVGNEVVGAIGVSGVQSSEDAQIARAGVTALAQKYP